MPSLDTAATVAGAPGILIAAASVEEVVVTAARLNEARTGLQPQVGATTYTIDSNAIDAAPGGANDLLNQVVLQAPDVAQDSFGQFHVRGEHNGLQYRLNGVILPEGISVFGQTLDPKLISSIQLITGALPAEYGLRTAGIIDLATKSGVFQPGGSLSFYTGTNGTVQPSFNYGGSSGNFNYFRIGRFPRMQRRRHRIARREWPTPSTIAPTSFMASAISKISSTWMIASRWFWVLPTASSKSPTN